MEYHDTDELYTPAFLSFHIYIYIWPDYGLFRPKLVAKI